MQFPVLNAGQWQLDKVDVAPTGDGSQSGVHENLGSAGSAAGKHALCFFCSLLQPVSTNLQLMLIGWLSIEVCSPPYKSS